jgi:hypothetical protein
MRIASVKFLVPALALLITMAAHGQSLGDVARENREAKARADSASATQPKVITNKDFPKDQEPEADSSDLPNGKNTDQPAGEHSAQQHSAQQRAAQQRLDRKRVAEQRAAEQWKRQILAQKHKLASLQARIDQLSASIQAANGTTQYEGPNGRAQARQLQRIAQVQLQLDDQKRSLLEMQEAARRAGMHTAVYDP